MPSKSVERRGLVGETRKHVRQHHEMPEGKGGHALEDVGVPESSLADGVDGLEELRGIRDVVEVVSAAKVGH